MKLPKTKELQGKLLWKLLESLATYTMADRIDFVRAAGRESIVPRDQTAVQAMAALQAIANETNTPVVVI